MENGKQGIGGAITSDYTLSYSGLSWQASIKLNASNKTELIMIYGFKDIFLVFYWLEVGRGSAH